MSKKLFIGNLPLTLEADDLRRLFALAGTVTSARVVADPNTGQKRGFGFVEMSNAEEAKTAAEMLNGTSVEGKPITVDVARERERVPREG